MKLFPNLFAIPQNKRGGTFLVLMALAVGVGAQLTLLRSPFDSPNYWNIEQWFTNLGANFSPVPGLSLYLMAGILLVFGLRLSGLGNPAPSQVFTGSRIALPPRFGFWLTSFGLAFLTAIYTAHPDEAEDNGYVLALLWILSLGLFSYSILRQSGWKMPSLSEIRHWISENRYELLGLAILLVAALLVRVIDLELHPYSMINDEGEMGSGGICLLTGECRNIFSIAWAAQPLVAYLPYGLSVALLGHSAAWPVRLVSVAIGLLAILFTYLFVREAFGKRAAFLAGILFATFPYHVHFSRIGIDNISDSFFSALLLWLLYRGIRKGGVGYFLSAGIVTGLCFYVYPGSRLVAALGVGALFYASLTQRGFLRAQASNLVIFVLATFLTVLPLVGTYTVYGGEFNARIQDVGIIQSGVLANEMQTKNLSAFQVLTREFFKSALPFVVTDGPFNFFDTPRAYFSALAAIFLMLGLALTFWKMFDLRNAIVLAWFFGPILGATLTVGAPSNQRMLGSSPAAVILSAIAIFTVLQSLQGSGAFLRRLAQLALVAALLFNSYQDLHFYFVDYRNGHYFEDLSNEITYESHIYTSALDGNGRLYLIGQPMTYIQFANFNYFAPNVDKMDFNDITPEAIAGLPKDKDAFFLAIPTREADLQKIVAWLPGGEWIAENRRYQPQQPLFFAYKVTKEQLQAYHP